MCNMFRQREAEADRESWIRRGEPARLRLPTWEDLCVLGIHPDWAKYPLANARAETAHEKATFRGAFSNARAVVPDVSGWREWMREERRQAELTIGECPEPRTHLAALHLPAFQTSASERGSFVVLTQNAAASIASVHHRMPVRLTPAEADEWLRTDVPGAIALLAQVATRDDAAGVTVSQPPAGNGSGGGGYGRGTATGSTGQRYHGPRRFTPVDDRPPAPTSDMRVG